MAKTIFEYNSIIFLKISKKSKFQICVVQTIKFEEYLNDKKLMFDKCYELKISYIAFIHF